MVASWLSPQPDNPLIPRPTRITRSCRFVDDNLNVLRRLFFFFPHRVFHVIPSPFSDYVIAPIAYF